MSHRELSTSDSHLEEWASLLGADLDDDGHDSDLLDEQDEPA
ncbi:hypothetical protein ACODNH_10365 [Haloarcula sp. NS06]|nr:hypothetical protein [Haloarcula sp. H-GB4]MDQ2073845.1 hypothetical protein [Haloarcula sp. H-GB4]